MITGKRLIIKGVNFEGYSINEVTPVEPDEVDVTDLFVLEAGAVYAETTHQSYGSIQASQIAYRMTRAFIDLGTYVDQGYTKLKVVVPKANTVNHQIYGTVFYYGASTSKTVGGYTISNADSEPAKLVTYDLPATARYVRITAPVNDTFMPFKAYMSKGGNE